MKYTIKELDEMRSLIRQLNPQWGSVNYSKNLEYTCMVETQLHTYIMNGTRANELEFEVRQKINEIAEAKKIFEDNMAELDAEHEAIFAGLRAAEKLRVEKSQKKNDINIVDHLIRALTR